MINKAIMMGRLTKDPELRVTNSGVSTCGFTLAIDRAFKNSQGEKETDFIPIVTWNKQAENCATYLKKGSMAIVEGRMQVRSYEDKEGQRRWVSEIVADNVRFVGGSKKSENDLPEETEQSFQDEIPF